MSKKIPVRRGKHKPSKLVKGGNTYEYNASTDTYRSGDSVLEAAIVASMIDSRPSYDSSPSYDSFSGDGGGFSGGGSSDSF